MRELTFEKRFYKQGLVKKAAGPEGKEYWAYGGDFGPHYTLHLIPSTLNPQPSTLNPQPSTLNPQLKTSNPQP